MVWPRGSPVYEDIRVDEQPCCRKDRQLVTPVALNINTFNVNTMCTLHSTTGGGSVTTHDHAIHSGVRMP